MPFWGGTYFPNVDRHNLPAFSRVLEAIAEAWRTRRDEVTSSGQRLRDALQQTIGPKPAEDLVDTHLLDAAARGLMQQYEPRHGGFGGAPKFPQPMALEFLLRQARRTGDERARHIAEHTLDSMARGGMYDQLGGGFHRYSTDDEWLVPHFEKMLYDNAQLARVYLMAFQMTGKPFYRDITQQVIEYVLRDMTDVDGGFYSTEDADSEGEEGKFYVWTPEEVRSLLGERDARLFCAYYDVTPRGNFEHGTSILRVTRGVADVAREHRVEAAELEDVLTRGRRVLFEARSSRVRPGRDDKVLTAWNGMFLRALAEAGRVLDRADFLSAAEKNAAFLLSTMRREDGGLYRTWKPGHAAHLNGYLEDYANVADGLIALYEATFDRRWLEAAVSLADAILERFADADNGGFFDTSSDHETLITRPKDVYDNATPSGNAVAADVMLRLAVLVARPDLQRAAQGVLDLVREGMERVPLGFARSLNALDFLLGRVREVVIVGQRGATDTAALVQAAFEPFSPNKVVAGLGPGEPGDLPLLEAREPRDGVATAYVCEHYVCQAPTTDPAVLRAQLSA
jgi:uncharacterized protein